MKNDDNILFLIYIHKFMKYNVYQINEQIMHSLHHLYLVSINLEIYFNHQKYVY